MIKILFLLLLNISLFSQNITEEINSKDIKNFLKEYKINFEKTDEILFSFINDNYSDKFLGLLYDTKDITSLNKDDLIKLLEFKRKLKKNLKFDYSIKNTYIENGFIVVETYIDTSTTDNSNIATIIRTKTTFYFRNIDKKLKVIKSKETVKFYQTRKDYNTYIPSPI